MGLFLISCSEGQPEFSMLSSASLDRPQLDDGLESQILSNNTASFTLSGDCDPRLDQLEWAIGFSAFSDVKDQFDSNSDIDCSDGRFQLKISNALAWGLNLQADGSSDTIRLRGKASDIYSSVETAEIKYETNNQSQNPSIQVPADQTLAFGTNTGPLLLSVNDPEGNLSCADVSVSSSNTTLIPSNLLSLNESDCTLKVEANSQFSVRTIANGLNTNTIQKVYAQSPDKIFVSNYTGYLFHSVDGGSSFSNITPSGLESEVMKDIYALGSKIYLGTTAGLYNSTDASGLSFSKVEALGTHSIESVVANASTNQVFVGTSANGLFILDDGGGTTTISSPLQVTDLFIHNDKLYRATTTGLYSTDLNGANQVQYLDTEYITVVVVSSSGAIFAGTYGSGIYVSQDGGVTFSQYKKPQGLGSNTIKDLYFDETNSTLYVATTTGLFKSDDNGSTFNKVILNDSPTLGVLSFMLLDDPITNEQYMYAGSNQGLFLNRFEGDSLITLSVTKESEVFSQSFKVTVQENSSCPIGFVPIPSNSAYTSKDFCVMKYEAKGSVPVASLPVSRPAGSPWSQLSRDAARNACQNLGTEYDLISNSQWQTIARNIEQVSSNWIPDGGGDYCLSQGNSGGGCGDYLGAIDYGGGRSTKSRHRLSNGHAIWDISGNLWEWVSDDNSFVYGSSPNYISLLTSIDGNEGPLGLPKHAFGPLGDYSSLVSSPYGGLGYASINAAGGAILRGGSYQSYDQTGVFAVKLEKSPTYLWDQIGFRCAYNP